MEHYQKGENISFVSSDYDEIVGEVLSALCHAQRGSQEGMDFVEVKTTSKLRTLVPSIVSQCKGGKGYCILVGCGAAVNKVASLSEMVRKRIGKKLTQWNSVRFTSVEELWLPKEEDTQLEALKVVRQMPCMAILFLYQENVEGQEKDIIDYQHLVNCSWTKQVELKTFLNSSTPGKKKNKKTKSPRKK